MQIVIDIPDGRYEELMNDDIHLDVPIFKEDIIATLPKGHGRLIDADNLSKDEYLENRYGTDFYWEFRRRVDKQPTIIEASEEGAIT